jgi:transcriptional regulator with XRE-family HTH domain
MAAGMSQSKLARKKTSQSYVARIEGGKVRPSSQALERFARATRIRLRTVFEPQPTRRHETESIYRRYAIVDEAMQREAAARLDAWITAPQTGRPAAPQLLFQEASDAGGAKN